MHRRRIIREFTQALAAAAARRNQRRSLAEDHHLDDPALACHDQCGNGRSLSAAPQRECRVLDIASSIERTAFAAHHGADGETGLGRVGARHRGACQLQHLRCPRFGRGIGHSSLLDIRYARSLGGDRLANEPGEEDHGQQVRQRLDQLHRHLADTDYMHALQANGDRVEEAKH